MVRQIVVVDVETTGLDPDRHIVVEVGWVNLATGAQGLFVPPHSTPDALANADLQALRMNRYIDRLADLPRDRNGDAAYTLAQQLEGNTLAGSNPAFDASFLTQMYVTQYSVDLDWEAPAWHHRLLDLSAYAAGVLAINPGELPGLHAVCERLGVTNDEPHTALGDARATAECFRRLSPMFTAHLTEGETAR
ncbi:3'-5' exonuclease [Amycolatopsis thermoflava]|uniref:3'-5' exonuclease n=1 Tax=Amycolatopsis thermoflava TaxID=84480 RepID=UPI003F4A0546